MTARDPITVASPEGLAVVGGVAALYLAIRFLPRLLVGPGRFVDPVEVERRRSSGEALLLLDVRSRAEFSSDTGHLPGALNVPLEDLEQALARGELEGVRETQTVVTICQSDARAAFAVRRLRRHGIHKVLVMSGGMGAWTEAGLPVDRT